MHIHSSDGDLFAGFRGVLIRANCFSLCFGSLKKFLWQNLFRAFNNKAVWTTLFSYHMTINLSTQIHPSSGRSLHSSTAKEQSSALQFHAPLYLSCLLNGKRAPSGKLMNNCITLIHHRFVLPKLVALKIAVDLECVWAQTESLHHAFILLLALFHFSSMTKSNDCQMKRWYCRRDIAPVRV